jgi:hypothetical protein
MMQKGMVSTVLDGGQKVTATPYGGGVVSAPLVVPASLIGILPINTPIVYVTFDDNTGLVISRMDGRWNGSSISAYTDGDAIIITTGEGEKS